jgi:nucleoside 2-deoxyribosyltransferase
MKKIVFVSGPIQGMENNQTYREVITQLCVQLGYEVIDPWLREKIIYRRKEPCWWNKVPPTDFVERDLRDIEKCDILIAYLPKLSAGTCMELFQAKRKGKEVIVVSEMECVSPWIVVHSDIILRSIEELKGVLENGQ